MGGAAGGGRNLQMPAGNLTRREASGADIRNLAPPSEDEQMLASLSRVFFLCLFCLAARRGVMYSFPEVDWSQVGLAIWQDLVSLSETAHSLFSDVGGTGGAGGPQPDL